MEHLPLPPSVSPEVAAFVKNHPDTVVQLMAGHGRLSSLFPGPSKEGIRQSIIETGIYKEKNRELRFKTRPLADGDHEVLAMAAISFDPGLTIDLIDTVQDFFPQSAVRAKTLEVQQLWKIYQTEGLINNAVNKVSAILSGGGTFKVRNAKLGRRPDATNRLLKVLETWQDLVNSPGDDQVVTGAQGLEQVTHQGVRRALVEGDWIARTVWNKVDVLNLGTFSLPVNVQSITTAELLPVRELQRVGATAWYWAPPNSVIDQITKPTDKNVAKIFKNFYPKELVGPLKKDRKVFLDPALMMHVRHRGVDTDTWGESFITPALQAIAYKRNIDQLDYSSMQNLINRLTIVMVGSADPNSPYAKTDVATARTELMQSFFETPGPNMTIVWAGDDVKVEDVGAYNEVLALDNRHNIAIGKIKDAIGVPEALLSGTTADGKAAGWAASLGSAAQLRELQDAFAHVWTTLGQRIAKENNFTEVDLEFEFNQSLLIDRVEEMNQTRADYIAGVSTIRDLLSARGKDPDAVFVQRCFERGLDPSTTTWEEAFMPPQGMAGQQQGGTVPAVNGPGQGRQPDSQQGKPTTPDRKTPPKTTENK